MSVCITGVNKVTLLLALAKSRDTPETRRETERFLKDNKAFIPSYHGTIIYTSLNADYIDPAGYNRYHGVHALETILSGLTGSLCAEVDWAGEEDERQSFLC